MIRKCDCKKCIYCELIGASNKKYTPYIMCKMHERREMVMPSYCDKFMTEKEFIAKGVDSSKYDKL